MEEDYSKPVVNDDESGVDEDGNYRFGFGDDYTNRGFVDRSYGFDGEGNI